MFGIGDTELVLILVFAFLLFGPDKLPSMGRTIGRGIRQFRQASDSVTKVVKSEVLDPLNQAANEDGVTRAPDAPASSDKEAPALSARSQETFAERKARLAKEKEAREHEARLKAAASSANKKIESVGDAPAAALGSEALPSPGADGEHDGALAQKGALEVPKAQNSKDSSALEAGSPPKSAAPTIASMWGLSATANQGTGKEDATDEPA